MSTDFERLLQDGMRRFTNDLGVPQGMAHQADLRQRKHRRTARAVTAAGTVVALAAAGVAAAGASGAFGAARVPAAGRGAGIRTTAYVTSHVEAALAASSLDNAIQYTLTRYQPAEPLEAPGLILGPPGPGQMPLPHSPSWPLGSTSSWDYRGVSKVSAVAASGQQLFAGAQTAGPPVTGVTAPGQGPATMVIYRNRTWWSGVPGDQWSKATGPAGNPPAGNGPRCWSANQSLSQAQDNGWPAFIAHQLHCGLYTAAGHQWVDGIDTIKLTGLQDRYTLWVNPATYLPVRTALTGTERVQADFEWLAPTPANLALLKLRIPAGFHRIPVP